MRLATRPVLLAILTAGTVVSASNAQTTLRFQFKEGETLHYSVEQKMNMSMNVMGMDIDTKLSTDVDITWNVVKVDSKGNAQIQIKVTRAKLGLDGSTGKVDLDSNDKDEPNDPIGKVLAPTIKALGAMELTGTMEPSGVLKDVKASESAAKALKDLPGADKLGEMLTPENFKNMVSSITFPAEPVSKGKTWTNKVETKTPVGKATVENLFTYDGPTEKEGASLEKISINPKIGIEADPNASIKMQLKSAKGDGQVYFDNKAGRLVESVVNQKLEMQIAVQGLNVTQSMVQTNVLRLKRDKKAD